MKKNILITGASSGVGYESALLLAQNGYIAFATMRNLEKPEALKRMIDLQDLDITKLELDVEVVDSINNAVEEVIQSEGVIDILLNNAGAGYAKTLEASSDDEILWVANVNYLGVMRCTKAVLPYMRKQKSGRVINVTSVEGLVGQPFNELYCGAKFAVEGFTESLASYLSDAFSLKFSLIEPGGISKEFMKSAVAKTMVEGQLATGEYLPIFQKYLAGSQRRAGESTTSEFQTGLEVAEVIFEIAETTEPPLRTRTSEWFNAFCDLKTQADPTGLKLVSQI